jgi:hypothetical protein
MRRGLRVLLALVLIVGGCRVFPADNEGFEDVAVADLVSVEPGTMVGFQGQVSLFGELFCPCFVVSDGGSSVVVWYDLMEGREPVSAAEVDAVRNGLRVQVQGELQPETDPGSGDRVVWASTIDVDR